MVQNSSFQKYHCHTLKKEIILLLLNQSARHKKILVIFQYMVKLTMLTMVTIILTKFRFSILVCTLNALAFRLPSEAIHFY